jgi:exopolysaccharide biosynthesis WecB/TagA/CpsF family protein
MSDPTAADASAGPTTSETDARVPSRRYVLVSPCRDEIDYVRRTLESVAAQTIPPTLWIIVDDGSTDGTTEVLEDYAKRRPHIRLVHRADRGARKVGPGVVDAFYAGLDTVDLASFDYVCKLDVDLDLPPRYFETLIERMEATPRLGTTSGKPYFAHPTTGDLVPETCGDEMSVGMTKFYRVSCFREIGGFVRQVMWDGIDCHRARMLGWIAESVDAPDLRFLHLRPQGSSQQNIWIGRQRAGFGQYFMGTSPLYYLAVAGYRLREHPAVVGSAGMLWGYLTSWARQLPRYEDAEFRKYLRSYQYACLRMGKRRATARAETERAHLWEARHGQVFAKPAVASRAAFLGVTFDLIDRKTAVDRCLAYIDAPRQTQTIITANASHICMLRRDGGFAAACANADMTIADGMSIVGALRARGERIPERVAGIDLMTALLDAGHRREASVYFLGATQEVLTELIAHCRRHYPNLRIVGSRNGYFNADDHAAIVAGIRNSRPDMLFVGMPSPFKEVFVEQHRDALNVPVVMGVGGSFDVLAGFIARAPRWLQTSGLEWAWRLGMEPRKLWKRYLTTNTQFLWLAARDVVTSRFTRVAPVPMKGEPSRGGA